MKDVFLTRDGHDKLQEEYEQLKRVKRREISNAISLHTN